MPHFYHVFLKVHAVPIVGCLALLTHFTGGQSARAETPVHTIIMKSISYDPKTIEIQPGDKVVWSNQSFTNHSGTADDGKAFDTGLIAPKSRSKELIFNRIGTFPYHCNLHGKSMSGEITVRPKASANPTLEGK